MAKTLDPALQDYFNGICCPEPVVTFNFDVTADWVTNGITDQTSFETWLGSSVTDFLLSGNTLKAITTGVTSLDFKGWASVSNITSLPSSLTNLMLNGNDSLSTIFDIPTLLDIIDIGGCNYNQTSLDNLAGQFLQGTLPKTEWVSDGQITSAQPSSSVKTDLTNGVTSVVF